MNFKETDGFRKDLKQLQKKFRSLSQDLELFKKLITAEPMGNGRNFAILHDSGPIKIIKARLFCRSLLRSSLRIIYAYCEKTGEIAWIEFIELYFKGQQVREDQKRIQDYLKSKISPGGPGRSDIDK